MWSTASRWAVLELIDSFMVGGPPMGGVMYGYHAFLSSSEVDVAIADPETCQRLRECIVYRMERVNRGTSGSGS